MGALLGLAAACAYGVSDFTAGLAARRTHFLWVGLFAQAVGVLAVFASLPWTGTDGAQPTALAWGSLSGVGSAAGTLALYRGYGRGEMAVAGPVSAVGAAAIPSVVGVATGDRLTVLGLAGVLLAFPSIWLMARQGNDQGGHVRTGVADGIVSGAGFALLFVALGQAGDGSGLWPVAAGQVTSLAVLAGGALLGTLGRLPRPTRSPATLCLVLAGGALGVAATILYFYATHAGLLTVSAVLTSTYPGVTVALAALVLKERPDPIQVLGLALGAAAVTAIVVG